MTDHKILVKKGLREGVAVRSMKSDKVTSTVYIKKDTVSGQFAAARSGNAASNGFNGPEPTPEEYADALEAFAEAEAAGRLVVARIDEGISLLRDSRLEVRTACDIAAESNRLAGMSGALIEALAPA